ncbi:NVEALA domain-containing protein [Duncaniella freteri]|uniref:NVEALA domain-containing protein n=1 Tax=Duncaniella freteri TaxID=2530391 RepID=UPI0033900905
MHNCMNKIFLTCMIAIVAICGFVGFRNLQKDLNHNPLELMNIEALSSNEDGYESVTYVDYPWGQGCNCFGKGSLYCC